MTPFGGMYLLFSFLNLFILSEAHPFFSWKFPLGEMTQSHQIPVSEVGDWREAA